MSSNKTTGHGFLFLLIFVAGFWIYWLQPWKSHKSLARPSTPVPRSASSVHASNLVVPSAAAEAPKKSDELSPSAAASPRAAAENLPEVDLPPGLPEDLVRLAPIAASEIIVKRMQQIASQWNHEIYKSLQRDINSPDETEHEDGVIIKKYKMKDGKMLHRSEYAMGGISEDIYDPQGEGYNNIGTRYTDDTGQVRRVAFRISDADLGYGRLGKKAIEGRHNLTFNSDGSVNQLDSTFENYAFTKEYANGHLAQKTFTIYETSETPYRPPQEF